MDYQVLKTTLQSAEYINLSVPEQVATINAPTKTMHKPRMVTARTILAECAAGSSILDKLEAAAATNCAVKWAVKFLGTDGGLDAGNPATLGMIASLGASGVLTSAEVAQLEALSLQAASHAEQLGLGFVHDSDVRDALRS